MQAYISRIDAPEFPEDGRLVLFFSGCNFSCPFCNTPAMLVTKEEFLIDTREIKRKLTESDDSSVLLTGGEPTFQRQALLEVLRFAKSVGKKTILHTNGSKPDTIRQLLAENLVDAFVLDIKAPLEEAIFEKVTRSSTFFVPARAIIDDTRKTIEMLRESSADVTVATTIVPGLLFKKEDVAKIANIADYLGSGLILQQFDNIVCHDTRYMSINPASFDFLQTLKDSVKKAYPKMQVEIRAASHF